MSMYRFYLTALMAGVLAACGDGDPVVPADEESDPGGEDVGAYGLALLYTGMLFRLFTLKRWPHWKIPISAIM